MGQCGEKLTQNEDIELGKNAYKMASNDKDHKQQEENNEQGKWDLAVIKDLLRLIEKNNVNDDDIRTIQNILKNNKRLLIYPYWKDNKVRSILHLAKYNSRMKYDVKRKVINTIVDQAYELFKFSQCSSISDKHRAMFFSAAKGNLEQLQQIVTDFQNQEMTEKIHDTCEGDTILSFMVKFGNHLQEHFLQCFRFMVETNVNIRRVDYFKKTVKEVILEEIEFLKNSDIADTNKDMYIQQLNEMVDIVDTSNQNVLLTAKHELFQAVIEKNTNFESLLTKDLLNSDDGENSILQLAVIKNNEGITSKLLSKGADPNLVVEGRNEEVPLVLAAKLGRDNIFKDILDNLKTKISEDTFAEFVKEKPKYLNSLLESKNLNVDIEYKDKTPLWYAIIKGNKTAVQSLLQRGSQVDETYLQYINPKDLEDYLNSCIVFDNFTPDMEEGNYKALLVFDFFINSRVHPVNEKKKCYEKHVESTPLIDKDSTSHERFYSEVAVIKNIGNNKRIKHLLEHPLIYIYIILKWHCIRKYYYLFVLLKFIFYIVIDVLLYTDSLNLYAAILVLIAQTLVMYCNYSEFKLKFNLYTLHFNVEIMLFIFLILVCILKSMQCLSSDTNVTSWTTQLSAFIIIFTSASMLMTIGYHLELSKWMAMAKRVFKNFSKLLLFFMIPIVAFATALRLLDSIDAGSGETEENSDDFSTLPRAIFRTLIMMGGDIGDKKFTVIGGYIAFIVFTVGMAIILLNFWTGVAVSDIKEIEEQSTIVAFKNVIVFIESVERMYHIFYISILKKLLCLEKCEYVNQKMSPCLKTKLKRSKKGKKNKKKLSEKMSLSKTQFDGNKKGKKSKKVKFACDIDLYINLPHQFKKNKYFKHCKLDHKIISKIKSLFGERGGENLKKLAEELEEINTKLNKIMNLLENNNKKVKVSNWQINKTD